MKFLTYILIALFFLFSFSLKSFAQDWQELKSEHFVVYFTQDDNFAQEVLGAAEVYYQRIASDIGYPRYSAFWTWDKRVKIYIYLDQSSYLKATGQPEWSQGMADYTNKQIMGYIRSTGFIESILPHEIAHLIFRDFVGFKGEIPLWLDEGVAQWSEELRRKQIKTMAKHLYNNNSLLTLKDMMNLDIKIMDKKAVYIRPILTKDGDKGVLFLSGDNLINTYYLQAASLVGFLMERYGSYSFADFCRQLRDGKTLEDALKNTYPAYIQNLDELERNWREYIDKN